MNFASKRIVKVLSIFIILLFANSVFAASTIINNNIKKGPVAYGINAYPPLSEQIIGAEPGTIVKFGHYEQDGNIENGKEDVEWILLDIDYHDRSATLISLYLIDCLKFNGFSMYVTWDNSSLRQYMNTTMYDDLFDENEKKCVKKTVLFNMPNPFFENEPSGLPTEDYLYIPAIEDMIKYFLEPNLLGEYNINDLLNQDVKRMAVGTDYAINNGLRVTPKEHMFPKMGNYFLRTIGRTGHRIWYNDVYADFFQSYVSEQGEVKPEGTGVNSMDDGIRPMVKVYF